jgi:hypothetical protein
MYEKIKTDISQTYYKQNFPNEGQRFVAYRAREHNILDWVVNFAGKAVNMALTNAANETLPPNRVFSPNNWIKTKTSLTGVTNVIQTQLMMLPDMGAAQQCKALVLPADAFEYRWQAD